MLCCGPAGGEGVESGLSKPSPWRSRVRLGWWLGSPPSILVNERRDPVADFVANPPYLLQGLTLRIVERPIISLQPRDIRTLLAASHRHEKKRVAGELFGQFLRPLTGEIDIELAHDLDDFGMNAVARPGPRRNGRRLRWIGEFREECRGHLGPPCVVHTREDHPLHLRPHGFRSSTTYPRRPLVSGAKAYSVYELHEPP